MGATVSRVMLLQQLLVIPKRTKRRREGGAKQTKTSLNLNQTPLNFNASQNKVCSFEPTLGPPYLCTMTTAMTIDSVHRLLSPPATNGQPQRRAARSFLVQTFCFSRSSSLLRKTKIEHCSFICLSLPFLKKTFIKKLVFLERHFWGSFSGFFPKFLGFFGQRHLRFVLYASLYLFRNKPCFFRTTSNTEPALRNRM